MFQPHDFQHDAIHRCRQEFLSGKRRVLLQSSCGSGKTIMSAEVTRLAVSRGKRVLYDIHRNEILAQTSRKLTLAGVEHALLKAGGKVPDAQVILASSLTLARRDVPRVDLLIPDETHVLHSHRKRLIAALPDAHVLGLTATPCRLDGKPLADLYEAMVLGPEPAWLVDHGYLVPAVVYAAESPDLHNVPFRAGEFAQSEAEPAFMQPRLVANAVQTWLKLASGRRTVCFTTGIKHSLQVRDAYRAAGVRAEHVDGQTPDALREDLFAALAEHRIDVLCNVGVAIEGLDIVEVSCVQWLRATGSDSIWIQGNGRGMRVSPETGKTDCIVLDHAGNTFRLGLPEQAREWTLAGKVGGTREAVNEDLLRHCQACMAIWLATTGQTCPRCGETVTCKPRKGPATTGGELVRVTAAELERRARTASREVPPRPAPKWVEASGLVDYWNRMERERHREGYALPVDGKRGSGYSESRCWRRMSVRGGRRAA